MHNETNKYYPQIHAGKEYIGIVSITINDPDLGKHHINAVDEKNRQQAKKDQISNFVSKDCLITGPR
jgi:hypothetical protein